MAINLENNFYAKAYLNFNALDYKFFKSNPKFQYWEPKFSIFSKLYNDTGWLQRKITAIPKAIWAATIKTTHHLAAAVLCTSCNGGKLYFKAKVFTVVRDLQESFGRIMILFSDKVGLYHVQQARFYKSCYECFYYCPENEHKQPARQLLPTSSAYQQRSTSQSGHRQSSFATISFWF